MELSNERIIEAIDFFIDYEKQHIEETRKRNIAILQNQYKEFREKFGYDYNLKYLMIKKLLNNGLLQEIQLSKLEKCISLQRDIYEYVDLMGFNKLIPIILSVLFNNFDKFKVEIKKIENEIEEFTLYHDMLYFNPLMIMATKYNRTLFIKYINNVIKRLEFGK